MSAPRYTARLPGKRVPQPKPTAKPTPKAKPKRGHWWLAAGCLLVLAAYANSFGLGFAGDPQVLVLKDPRIRALTAENLGLIFHNDYWYLNYSSGLFRPVTTLSFLFNYAIMGNGESPAGYHWINFLLHLGNVALVFAVARRLFAKDAPALFAAGLWAVHPIGTEAVANIGGRADLLSAMAVLGGLWLYIRARDENGRRLWIFAAALCAVLIAGVFSKENTAVLPGLMLLWEVSRTGIVRRQAGLALYAAAGVGLAVAWAVRYMVLRPLPWAPPPYVDNPLIGAGFWTSRFAAIKVIAIDLGLMIWPMRLSSDRSYNQIPVTGSWTALFLVIAIAAVVLWLRRRDTAIFFGAGFLAVALLPTSNLVLHIGAMLAERFLYLPAVGLAIVAAALVWRISDRRVRAAVMAVLLLAAAVRTRARNSAWDDDLTLASADVETAPWSFKLHTLLAQALMQHDPRANIDRAIDELEAARTILHGLTDLRMPQQNLISLGNLYLIKGNQLGGPGTDPGRGWYERAIPVLERAREVSQVNEKAWDDSQREHGRPLGERFAPQDLYYELGVAYGSLGRYQEALDTLRYGQAISPGRPDFYPALYAAYTGLGQPERGATALLEGYEAIGPSPETVAALKEAYARVKDGACAVSDASDTMKLNLDCPRVKADLCVAEQQLLEAYRQARLTPPAGLSAWCPGK